MNIRKKIITPFIILFILVVIFVIVFLFSKKDKGNNYSKLQFLSTNIFLAGNINEEITLPTVFVTDIKTDPRKIIEDVKLINSDNLKIKKWKIIDGSKYKNIKLYNISLVLKILKNGKCDIDGIDLLYKDGTKHSIKFDKFVLNSFSNSQRNLTVSSRETYLANDNNRIMFDLKNISNNVLQLKGLKVYSDDISIVNANYKINDEALESIYNQKLNYNEILDIEFEYNIDELDTDLVFIRPYFEYTIGDSTYNEPVTQGSVFGLPFSKEKMKKIYSSYVGD